MGLGSGFAGCVREMGLYLAGVNVPHNPEIIAPKVLSSSEPKNKQLRNPPVKIPKKSTKIKEGSELRNPSEPLRNLLPQLGRRFWLFHVQRFFLFRYIHCAREFHTACYAVWDQEKFCKILQELYLCQDRQDRQNRSVDCCGCLWLQAESKSWIKEAQSLLFLNNLVSNRLCLPAANKKLNQSAEGPSRCFFKIQGTWPSGHYRQTGRWDS